MATYNVGMDFATLRADLIGSDVLVTTPFGQRRVTYADYVASGKPLRSVEDRIRDLALPLYANTHTEDSVTGAASTHLAHQAHDYVKGQLGADDHCKLIFCGSGSTAAIKRLQEILGLSVCSTQRDRTVQALPPEQRPVVFVGPYEHHSNEVSWRETLAEVVEVPLCAEGGICLSTLERELTRPEYAGRPRYGAFSAASNVTGRLSDTRALARLLHQHGAYAFFDFAASAPYVAIDMKPGEPDGYDAVFLSPHKFVGGPGTPGLLCFRAELYGQGQAPTTAGGGTVTYVSRHKHAYVDDIEAREDAGTPAILGKIRTALTFRVKEELGTDRLLAREHELYALARERFARHPRLRLLGSLDAPRLAFLSFIVQLPGGKTLHPRLTVRLLNDLFGIQARGGCACAGPYGHALLDIGDELSEQYFGCISGGLDGLKPGWTRLNLAPWITDEEATFILDAVEFVADYGEQFLAVYDFDWQIGAWTHPADQPAPDLFGMTRLPTEQGPVPYAAYLAQARALVGTLPAPQPKPAPSEARPELVYFAY